MPVYSPSRPGRPAGWSGVRLDFDPGGSRTRLGPSPRPRCARVAGTRTRWRRQRWRRCRQQQQPDIEAWFLYTCDVDRSRRANARPCDLELSNQTRGTRIDRYGPTGLLYPPAGSIAAATTDCSPRRTVAVLAPRDCSPLTTD